jgi:hypothetical protein
MFDEGSIMEPRGPIDPRGTFSLRQALIEARLADGEPGTAAPPLFPPNLPVPTGLFRLIVDLPDAVADVVDTLASAYGVSQAEVTRRAIATEFLLYRAEQEGGRLYMQRRGRRYRLRRRATTPTQAPPATTPPPEGKSDNYPGFFDQS